MEVPYHNYRYHGYSPWFIWFLLFGAVRAAVVGLFLHLESLAMAAAVQAIRDKKRREAFIRATQERIGPIFRQYDEDGSGQIDRDELTIALSALGLNVSHKQASVIISRYVPAGQPELNLQQFGNVVDDLLQTTSAVPRGPSVLTAPQAACSPLLKLLPIWRGHETAAYVYNLKWMQMLVAAMIVGNFMVNVLEKEIDPFPADMQVHFVIWENFDKAFNIIFRARA